MLAILALDVLEFDGFVMRHTLWIGLHRRVFIAGESLALLE